jgi:predicted permease
MPTGANAYIFAGRYGVAESVAGAVAVSTMVAVLSITVVLWFIGGTP